MNDDEVFIHPSATVHPSAEIEKGVWIGPGCFIGEKVTVRRNTRIVANVFIDGRTEIGTDCHFSPFSSIGTEPQDVSYKGEETRVIIGDRNIFREFITVHRGSAKGGGQTVIDNDNYFMAYSHIAHDCSIGSETVFTNAATLGGHVTVEDYVYISAFSGIHQFCRIGRCAFIGGFTVVTQDVLPFCRVAGMRPVLFYGLNSLGLRRRGFSQERIGRIKSMFKVIFHSDLNTTQAVQEIESLFPSDGDAEEIVQFIRSSKRGIIKKTAGQWETESE